MTRVLDGLWQFQGVHPEWTEDEGGEEGWEPSVAWWAVATPTGLTLIDPLVEDWDALDQLVRAHGGCAAIVRTCHWHQRNIADAALRYHAPVYAKPAEHEGDAGPFDSPLRDGEELLGALRVYAVERTDELAVWLPAQSALIFADAMIRSSSGELRVCPESWTQAPGGRPHLLALLGQLAELPVQHVLVSHGPLVLGDGADAIRAALA